MPKVQGDRIVKLKTALGDNDLMFKRMSGNEPISGLFEYELELFSEKGNIDPDVLIGDTATVSLEMLNGSTRYFNGYISRFSQVGFVGTMARFQCTLVPWLWLLTRRTDCKIFQEKKVTDIIKEVFDEAGFSDYEVSVTGEYRTWEYCVQYNETDFNFVSRLMEQEGIYYFFKHEDGKHTLVLADSYSCHETVPDYAEIPFFPPDGTAQRPRDYISGWSLIHQVQSGAFAHNDFDFKKPKKILESTSSAPKGHPKADYEIYNYPGEYVEPGEGENYSKIRREELQSTYQNYQGEGNAQGVSTGALFKLTDLPRDDQNKEYLVLSTNHQIESNDLDVGSGSSGEVSCNVFFNAIDSKEKFRAPRITPKATILGLQTAMVTGPSGEEIFTDEFGRVKVQFHWDRYGKSDEDSSCWIRVSQTWAGNTWGSIHIPRIGHEVIVEFLNGDPDRPLITGRVYNGDAKPPYELPANKTQSGIKSRSTKDGGAANFNEIRFEDLKDSEEFYEHAEKDKTIITENDKNQQTGHDETLTIGNDRTKTVSNDETTSVGNDRSENVGNDETIVIGNNRTESVGKDESITIGNNRTESVGKNENISIGENRDETVAKNETISIGKSQTVDVGKDRAVSIGGNHARSVEKDESISITGALSIAVEKDSTKEVTKNYTLKAKKISITAEDQLQIVVGSAKLIMKKDGTIQIKGKDINLKGSGNIKIKGSKIAEN